MASLTSIIAEIISELTDIQNGTKPAVEKNDPFPIPRMIGTSDDAGIIVSRKVDDLITSVSRELKSSDQGLVRRVQDEEWNKFVRAAFGPALAKIDLADDLQQNAKAVLDDVRASIAQSAAGYGKCEHAFACTLFSNNTKIDAFSIGQVRFEPKLDWLKRKFDDGFIPKTSYQRILKAWDGKRLGKRKPSFESIHEEGILDSIGTSPYVCSVDTDGFASDAGKEKALMAARLALTSISLLWQTPSKALDGFNLSYDRTLHRQKSLSFVPGKVVLPGSKFSHSPHGPYLKNGVWEEMFADAADHFKATAEILDYFLSPTGSVVRPKLMNTLALALLWFHEGCRETVPVMAVVNFAASMDAIGRGKAAGGIRKVITARLGLKDGDPIRKDGPKMKEAIDRIYSEGRSRTIHGTTDRLGHDWSSMRALSEQFARLLLLSCIDWAAKHPALGEPADLGR